MEQDEELRLMKFTEHIYYEIDMLNRIAEKLVTSTEVTNSTTNTESVVIISQELEKNILNDRIINNALIESFGTHARLLLEFISKTESRYDNTVFAINFVQDKEKWINYLEENKEDFNKVDELIWDRASEEIMHMCERRIKITEEQKKWNFGEIRNKLNKHIKAFLDQASDKLLMRKELAYALID